ncbi:MAG: ATP-dependent DNA helicase RecG, partial [Lachnospiraceae bacterium]
MITSDSPITALPGVGEARAKAFKKLGVENVRGLLCHYPRAYQYRGHVRSVAEARSVEGPVSLVLQVVSVPEEHRAYGRGKSYLRFRASDGTGTVSVTFFNQPFLKDTFRPERRFRFWGKLDTSHGVSMTSPVYEPCVDSTGAELAPIVPVYPLSAGLSQKFISERVRTALGAVITESDMLPASVLLENGLCTYSFAMRNIHFPENTDALERARRRLMFEQLFVLSASLCMKKAQRTVSGARALESSDLSPFTDLLPYEMTDAQKRSVGEIASDLARCVPMKRILCGDVGSGKTVCAFAAAYIAVKSGAQAALMAPTEILAKQHYAEAKPLFEKLGFTVSLLCGSMTKAQKDKTRRMLEGADGERIDFIIGTHALLTESVKFDDLGLVITDEQHRFGVMQRAALEEKAENVHTLVMSATPIPRTLSLIKYGDLDISRIDEMPRGRKKIGTFCVDSSYRDRLNAFIEKQAAKGHQTYVVCPAIEEQA